MQGALSKRVFSGIASDAHHLPPLLDNSNAPNLPRSAKLLRAVCVRAIALRATTIGESFAETNSKRETLKSDVSSLSAPEADEIATIHVHEGRNLLRGYTHVGILSATGKEYIGHTHHFSSPILFFHAYINTHIP